MRIIIRLPWRRPLVGLLLIGAMLTATAGQAIDVITKRVGDGTTAAIEGMVISDSGDEYLSIVTPNGRMELLGVEQIVARERDERAFEPLDKKELAAELLKELPAGFKSYSTKHYLILFDGPTDGVLVGSLAERFYDEYFSFWKKQKWELQEPVFPLVVVLFANRGAFIKYLPAEWRKEGQAGIYNRATNQAVISGPDKAERKRRAANRSRTPGKVLHTLTIHALIHECAHQLGHNCGLFLRHRSAPNWVDEGLAEYFASHSWLQDDGWRGVGQPHPHVLKQLKTSGVEIEELIGDDPAFRSKSSGYEHAWGVNYFLLRKRPDAYIEYLRTVYDDVHSDRRTARQRVAIFERSVGDLFELQKEFDKDLAELVAAE